MLLPLGDDNSDRRITPVVNYILIVLNILAFGNGFLKKKAFSKSSLLICLAFFQCGHRMKYPGDWYY